MMVYWLVLRHSSFSPCAKTSKWKGQHSELFQPDITSGNLVFAHRDIVEAVDMPHLPPES